MGLGWLWYLPFASGQVPGWHKLAWLYSHLSWGAVVLVLWTLVTLPLVGAALAILAGLSLKATWRRASRQGAKVLLVGLLIELLAIAALLPPLLAGYWPLTKLAIAPWHQTFRTVNVGFVLADNYGDLMVLRCDRLGLCRQVYRAYTDVESAQAATLQLNADTTQVALKLEGQWVYVAAADAELCRAASPRSATDFGKCSFAP